MSSRLSSVGWYRNSTSRRSPGPSTIWPPSGASTGTFEGIRLEKGPTTQSLVPRFSSRSGTVRSKSAYTEPNGSSGHARRSWHGGPSMPSPKSATSTGRKPPVSSRLAVRTPTAVGEKTTSMRTRSPGNRRFGGGDTVKPSAPTTRAASMSTGHRPTFSTVSGSAEEVPSWTRPKSSDGGDAASRGDPTRASAESCPGRARRPSCPTTKTGTSTVASYPWPSSSPGSASNRTRSATEPPGGTSASGTSALHRDRPEGSLGSVAATGPSARDWRLTFSHVAVPSTEAPSDTYPRSMGDRQRSGTSTTCALSSALARTPSADSATTPTARRDSGPRRATNPTSNPPLPESADGSGPRKSGETGSSRSET